MVLNAIKRIFRKKEIRYSPYIEYDTECDKCEFLEKCKGDGYVVNCTTYEDTREHFIRGLVSDSNKLGGYMKKVRNTLICATFLIVGLFLGACATTTYAEQEKPLKIWFENRNGKMETYSLVDENTGVNYIVVSGELYQKGIGTAITPRLNPDGTLYVSK